MPGDEPGFVVASSKLDERGSQLFDGVEGPHPQQLQKAESPVPGLHFQRPGPAGQRLSHRAQAESRPRLSLAGDLACWNDYARHDGERYGLARAPISYRLRVMALGGEDDDW